MTENGSRAGPRNRAPKKDSLEGIVIADARWASEDRLRPRISAFIWGGKVRPTPTLPFGRWKGAA